MTNGAGNSTAPSEPRQCAGFTLEQGLHAPAGTSPKSGCASAGGSGQREMDRYAQAVKKLNLQIK